MGITDILGIIFLSFLFVIIGISIAAFVVFVRLANRSMKALDIYIKKNQNNDNDK